MKIEAFTASPKQLVAAIDKAMNEGDLKTWAIVKNSQGDPIYTHTPPQWNEKALIVRQAAEDRVIFIINYWKGGSEPSAEIKGYYFGRFTEILLVHFRSYYSKLEVF